MQRRVAKVMGERTRREERGENNRAATRDEVEKDGVEGSPASKRRRRKSRICCLHEGEMRQQASLQIRKGATKKKEGRTQKERARASAVRRYAAA